MYGLYFNIFSSVSAVVFIVNSVYNFFLPSDNAFVPCKPAGQRHTKSYLRGGGPEPSNSPVADCSQAEQRVRISNARASVTGDGAFSSTEHRPRNGF